jgi:hypothetical protein
MKLSVRRLIFTPNRYQSGVVNFLLIDRLSVLIHKSPPFEILNVLLCIIATMKTYVNPENDAYYRPMVKYNVIPDLIGKLYRL